MSNRNKILYTMILLIIGCGLTILTTSFVLYNSEINTVWYYVFNGIVITIIVIYLLYSKKKEIELAEVTVENTDESKGA